MPDGDKPAPHLGALSFCPECQAPLPPDALEAHLRHDHRLYLFRGVRRPFPDTFALLLERLTTARPDRDAWPALTALAREEYGPRADFFVAAALGPALARVAAEQRPARVEALALLLAEEAPAALVAHLAAEDEEAARHLALALMARWPRPLDADLWPILRALLIDRRLSADAQTAALAAVIRSHGPAAAVVADLLPTLVAGLGKADGADRLRELEQLAGPSPAVTALRERLEEKVRLACPRCDAQLKQAEMVRHLWDVHRLLLDGRRVREPWALIDEWVEASRDDPRLAARCRDLARRLDGEEGVRRVDRLLLARGVGTREARRELLEEAGDNHAALCPWCYAEVAVPREGAPLAVTLRGGRLAAEGYAVALAEDGWRTALEVRAPGRLLYQGPEPGRYWTWRGAEYVLVGPWLLLALAAALWWPAPLAPVCVLLLGALASYGAARYLWRATISLPRRVRQYAWRLLAARLFEEASAVDGAFLAGLAGLPRAEGDAEARRDVLPDLLPKVARAVAEAGVPPEYLAVLYRLATEDAAARGDDPVPPVVEEVARCFQGGLPLRYAEVLLAGWRGPLWTPGRLARLRLLLCDRAFEAGFEVGNLLDAGQTAPALGAVLRTDEPAALAALRLLWSLRPTRPWDRCGPSQTAFELAGERGREALFGEFYDLLLYQEEPDWPWVSYGSGPLEPVRIVLSVRGVWLQSALYTEPPLVAEVNRKGQGYELVLGPHVFRAHQPLDEAAARMDRWCRYAFHEFLPAVAAVQTWQSPDRAAILRAWGAAPCPRCGRYLLARVGEVGIALDEAAPAAV